MTEQEKQERMQNFFKMLAEAGITKTLIVSPPPGGTVEGKITQDGRVLCMGADGEFREIRPDLGKDLTAEQSGNTK